MVAGRALELERRPGCHHMQALVGVEHVRQPDQILLVAAAAVVEDQQSVRLGARRALGEGEGHRAGA